MKYMAPASLLVVALFAFALSGCGSESAEQNSSSSPAASDGQGSHDHGGHAGQGNDSQSNMDKMKAELAKLSPEDAKSAEKQHMCPVSGEMLGTMGAPKKVDVKGQQVWICCDACKDTLLEKPDEFLAKLNKK